MKKVVLLAINAKYVHSSLSVWVIAEGVRRFARFPHDVSVIEATINQSCTDIAHRVTEHEPDVIGISSYIWNAAIMPKLLMLLRECLPDSTIVLGGPEASYNMDFWLESGADFVLQGEGEFVFPRFLDAVVGETTRTVPLYPVNPYTTQYLDALNGRLAYIETSRGCPFKCSFCLSAGSEVKYFPLETIKSQILTLSKSSAKTIKFVDRTFNCNAARTCELFEFIIEMDTTCRFHFEVAADLFDEKMLSFLEIAPPGRLQFEIGLQSFHEPVLKASSRQMDLKKAEKNIRTLMKMQNIHIHIDLIAGLPFETIEDFKDSFDRAYTLDTHILQLGFLKLLHGSELRTQAEDFGLKYSSNPPYEIISSPWLSSGDIQTLKHTENALQHTRNKSRFLTTLEYVLTATGDRPFTLLSSLGAAVPSHATQLENYIVKIFDFFLQQPGVEENALKDCLVYDWLGMVKGKNTPAFLKCDDAQKSLVAGRKKVAETAERVLGRKLRREEFALLNSGKGIFVDSSNRNPVTGLYDVLS
ncbi:MAG: B12-binding domain-containing radical SAM protein [Oscillospiraceae bacterium]|nr:B12-binding domain-containing radical SAM protein [Oscillospiraceae bacterium]